MREPWRKLLKIGSTCVGILAAPTLVLFALYYLFVIWQFHKAWLYNGDGTAYQGTSSSLLMTIRVGKVDLSRPGIARFSLSRIPYDEAWIGLELPSTVSEAPNANVRLTLTNSDGQIVMQEAGALSSWKRSSREKVMSAKSQTIESLVLRQDGEGREVRVDHAGDTSYERLGVHSDGGWGMHFTPRFFAKYELEISIDQPDPTYTQPITVLVQAEPTMFAP